MATTMCSNPSFYYPNTCCIQREEEYNIRCDTSHIFGSNKRHSRRQNTNAKKARKVVRFRDEEICSNHNVNGNSNETIIYYQDELDPQERDNLWLQTQDLVCIRNRIRSSVTEYKEKRNSGSFQKQCHDDDDDDDDDDSVCFRGIEKLICDRATRSRQQEQKKIHRQTILKQYYYYHHYNQQQQQQQKNTGSRLSRNNIHTMIAKMSAELSKFAQLRAENRAFQDQEDAKKVYENNNNNNNNCNNCKKRKTTTTTAMDLFFLNNLTDEDNDFSLSYHHHDYFPRRKKLCKEWRE